MDHYQSVPTEFDPQLQRGNDTAQTKSLPKIPVIRVFGATETGQKVCAHVHGAFPYLYVEYDGELDAKQVDSYVHQLHLSIDHALSVSYRRNIYDGQTAFVAYITLIKGTPFYGYSVGYRFFLKIYLLNPMHITRLADLLRQSAVMKRAFQPYESHMQYIPQWMCDYNLYGCAYIDCRKVMFRSPVPSSEELKSTSHKWHDQTISPSIVSGDGILPRSSHCSIEVDVCVQDIANREDIEPRPLHHNFIERANPVTSNEKLVHSMAGLWKDETRRRKQRMGLKDPSSTPFPPEVLISVSADPRNTQPGGWIHEEDYKRKMLSIIQDERERNSEEDVSFETFVRHSSFEAGVKTALESVEDLFPANLPKIRLSQPDELARALDQELIVIDEKMVLDSEATEQTYGSDSDAPGQITKPESNVADRIDAITGQGNINGTVHNDDQAMQEQQSHAVKLQNSFGPSATKPPGLFSSTQLEASGVRSAGDYGHTDEDIFAAPEAHVSDISSAIARHKRILDKDSEPQSSHKRPRLYPDRTHRTSSQLEAGSQGENESAEVSPKSTQSSFSSRGKRNPRGTSPTSRYSSQGLPHVTAKPPRNLSSSQGLVPKAHNSTHNVIASQKSLPQILRNATSKALVDYGTQLLKSDTRNPTAPSSQTVAVVSRLHEAFSFKEERKIFSVGRSPLPSSDLTLTFQKGRIPLIIHKDAYFSEELDVPERAREYAGREFKLESSTLPYMPEFDPSGMSLASIGEKPPLILNRRALIKEHQHRRNRCNLRRWEIDRLPPSRADVHKWLDGDLAQTHNSTEVKRHTKRKVSQVDGPTQKNKHGFKYSQKQLSTSVQHETQYMSLMSLEVHVNTRGSLVPNPEQDEIACVFWCIQCDDEELEANGNRDSTHIGILALSEEDGLAQKISLQTSVEVEEEPTELDLITRMVDIVRRYDPDVLTGFEVHGGSWGYLIERARCKYDFNLCDELSRTKFQSHGRFGKDDDRWGFNHTSTIRVTGRHTINVWRAMRGELNLLQYTMENIVFHLLQRRVPHFTFADLTKWYISQRPKDLAKVISYYVSRVQLDLEILEQNELIPRTSEQARLLGVDFFSVFSRGSQFKVESLMFRIAKPENFLLISPSRKQVGQQNALECLPLVMEPQSAFFPSPMLVLDFQSLYPSVMIAYNYCYSTFLGRVVNWRGQNKMGFTNYEREERLLELFENQINLAPNGMMYVKPEIRKSLLAKMLGEILETRVMVKSGMKVDKEDKTLQRLLNNRQLALKLIANVTYGYTSASFSGRMPCSEIADSIVQTGRETLEKAIAVIHSVARWNAEVVYGDTDSLFVYLKGRTRDQAFDIGNEIAKAITDLNPRPVKLKFEKVYSPCVLLAKKRYVGFKYESKAQEEPEFDAKGIETVRRDGTPAEQKIEEKALKLLFRTADLSQVKSYFQKQCSKIMAGRVSIQDFCFAREVKLGTYSDKGPPPPGALISTKRMLADPRAEPQYGERVPYVVITGAPGARLIDRCVAPDVLLQNDHVELDAEYYISKNLIPPLERIFNLVGANVRQWYDEMPKFRRTRRIQRLLVPDDHENAMVKKTLESYLKTSCCLVCRRKIDDEEPICNDCLGQPQASLLVLRARLNHAERRSGNIASICRSCAGLSFGEDVTCDSKDCPVFYTRWKQGSDLRSMHADAVLAIRLLETQVSKALDW